MSDVTLTNTSPHTKPVSHWLDFRLRALVQRRAAKLIEGTLSIQEGTARHDFAGSADPQALSAEISVHDPRFYRKVALGGSIGAAEAYMDGWWSSPDLVKVVRLLVRNRQFLATVDGGFTRLTRLLGRCRHWLRRNTHRGSRRNIAAHYDLGNEFFELFLDDTLTYSCGYFESPDAGMREASIAKLDRICRKLDLQPHDHVLEIGTGWGSFALHAAGEYGCRVTSTTISKQQYIRAEQRIREAGLQDRVHLLLQDYRDLQGRYDKLVSIEMIEAVGHAYYDTFFRQCARLLEPDGAMCLQAITIQEQEFERAKRDTDFIKQYIFPGSCIPSVSALSGAMGRSSDLRLHDVEDITPHYATTLRRWCARFLGNRDGLRELGLSEQFLRLWEYYFCYCEGGFREQYIGNVQMMLVKPGWAKQVSHRLEHANMEPACTRL